MSSNAGAKSSKDTPTPEADPEGGLAARRPGPWPPRIEPLPSNHGHNPKVLRSWARRTGYKSTASGETVASSNSDAEAAKTDVPIQKRPTRMRPKDLEKPSVQVNSSKEKPKSRADTVVDVDGTILPESGSEPPPPVSERKSSGAQQQRETPRIKRESRRGSKDSEADVLPQLQGADDVLLTRQSHMKYELRETPGIVLLIYYGLQHYLSIAGSIVLIPIVIVPAMGGTDEDTAHVVSTVLLVTGLATLMHTFLGSRLPLIQGPSFVYLAPALRFKRTMRELQGAVIISSAVQVLLGYSGLMSILLRLINPVVVTPTVAAVGLAFFTYGFPVVGACVEIGIPQILVVVFFALHLRKISFFGLRVFQIFAVPLGAGIVWAYAFLLTEAGAFNYKGCSVHVPTSNIISDECRRHVFTMTHCRTDVSLAMKTAAWFRFPYPFQWGIPTFHWKTGCLMIVASLVAIIDSVGSYHASSLLVAARAPTPGVVSRAIGLEGLTSVLAGIWGIGTGATTLTENVHTLAVTKMGSRRAIELGACVLILMSLVGKIGAFIASMPQVIAAGLLCIMWTMLTALGLSNFRYSETGSSRNVIIVGLSLFLSLSVPIYFQRYAVSLSTATVPSYLLPYTVPAHGPIRTSIPGVNFLLNAALSLNMVIALLVAFVLDNTVPGSRQERGTYVWTKPRAARREPAILKDYSLPHGFARFFSWARWVGI
ncbi:hypothetical protein KP509_39G040900 [Ceratopteris richardii]|uniref:Nucleobase-ascorbate transporter 12 n=1 Tax=Ceratopteris richardii TaxID=49495 RepID=A0A8T2Q0F9_CERRI|nr:hypothetical protein KP509_39G040900 [Ceratopteris richardii]